MSKFSQLQKKHEKLLLAQMAKEIKKSDVQGFLDSIVSASKNISSARERDQLRANLRYWANFIYEETGAYPNLDLLPSRISLLSSILTGVFIVVALVLLFSFVSYQIVDLPSYLPSATPVVTPTSMCPVQPASQLLVEPSAGKTKFIMVLFDKSTSFSQYTNETIDFAKNAILPEISMGDRLAMAWIDSGVTGDTIFFNERVPKVEFPVIPPTPALVVTPTLSADNTNLPMFNIQATNVAIDSSNETLIQQRYSCDIGMWNSEFNQLYDAWLPQQIMLENDFREKAAKALGQYEIKSFDKDTAIYDSLYLASRLFNSVIDKKEYDSYILIIFSDLVDSNPLPSREYNIDLSEVNVIMATSCESAIICQSRYDFWEKEFLSFGVRKTTMLLFPYETTVSNIRNLINNLSNP